MSNVYLIGMRGVGKTSTGKALAAMRSAEFIDLDHEIVRLEQQSIPDMVADKGWDFFRKKEHEALAQLLKKDAVILATGGGVLMFYDNADQLKSRGKLILLTATPETMAKRIALSTDRPSLTGKDVQEELAEVWQEREATYRKYADFTIDTEGKTPEEVAREISLRCLED